MAISALTSASESSLARWSSLISLPAAAFSLICSMDLSVFFSFFSCFAGSAAFDACLAASSLLVSSSSAAAAAAAAAASSAFLCLA